MRSYVRCPTCRQKLLLTTDEQGKRKRCPRCATRFAVGSPLHVVNGLVEFMAFELFDEDPVDDIEVLDDEIEVLDEPPAPVVVVNPAPPVTKKRKTKGHRDEGADDAEYIDTGADEPDPETAEYQFRPRDRPKWNLVQWGVTLVLLPLLLYLASFALSFSSLFIGLGSGIDLGGSVLVGGVIAVSCDVLRLVGYVLCLNVPGKSMNRIWVMLALGLSVGGGTVLIIPIAAAAAIGELAVVLGLYGLGMTVAMCGWGAYLLFLEGVAEMFHERGIADSVSGLIKLGSMYMVCVLALYIALVVMIAIRFNEQGLARADPSEIVYGIGWGIFCAFTAILGLVVFIKYILVLFNIREMIDWCT